MSVVLRELKAVPCPNCSAATILLWARKNVCTSIPLCEACFTELKKRSRKKASKHQIHFAPSLIHSDPESWVVSPQRQYEFRELKRFIDHCLDPKNGDSELDNFI